MRAKFGVKRRITFATGKDILPEGAMERFASQQGRPEDENMNTQR